MMLNPSNVEIQHALQSLQKTSPNIHAVTLGSIEGRIMECTDLTFAEKMQVGSTGAALLAIANKMANYMLLGDAKQLHIKGEIGSVLLFRAGAKAILAVIINGNVSLDTIAYEAQRMANRLSSLV